MRCVLVFVNDQMMVEDIETGKQYRVYSYKKSGKHKWHITFVDLFDKYWAMTNKMGAFVARKYKNYHSVSGGSGHHNTAYIRNKHLGRR